MLMKNGWEKHLQITKIMPYNLMALKLHFIKK